MLSNYQRQLKRQYDWGHGVDRISKLSDLLLHHILSFLNIKCVVRTSILSKRWRNIWTSLSSLDFQNWWPRTSKNTHLATMRFMNFMDRILLRRGISKIKKFGLSCNEHFDESRINGWISTIIKCEVEELILIIQDKNASPIPLSLFTCESLIKLKLEVHSILDLPITITFPRLRYLQFDRVKFRDEYLTEQLFSTSPVLEDLILQECTWVNMKSVCISAPGLKRLKINNSYGANVDNLKYCVVKINAPGLKHFTYKGTVAKEYLLSCFPSLVDAEIDLAIRKNHSETMQEEIGNGASLTKLFGGLSNVKHLKVCSLTTLEALSSADHLLSNLPIFLNMIQLEVTSTVEYLADKVLSCLLQLAPNLESLVFVEGFSDWSYDQYDDDWTLDMVSGCSFLQLKSVVFGDFTGHTREMDMLELVLKNASALQTMTIRPSAFLEEYQDTKVEVMEQLLRLPRGSATCVIEFSYYTGFD